MFIAHLIDTNKQSSTIKCYISVVRAILKQDKIKLKEDQFLITSLTRAACLKNDCVRLRLPIQRGLLGVILRQVRRHYKGDLNQEYLFILYQTIFSTGYFGLFCIGELTTGDHPVLASDVHIGFNKRKILFILGTSKTHWKNSKPQSVKICSQKTGERNTTDILEQTQFTTLAHTSHEQI